MGKIEDITRTVLTERLERERVAIEARRLEEARENEEQRQKELARNVTAQRVLRQTTSRLLEDLLARGAPGDYLVRVNVIKRRLGFLWRYVATTGPELAAWSLTWPNHHFLLLSDGRLAVRREQHTAGGPPGIWTTTSGTASVLSTLYCSPHPRVKTFLYQELQAVSDWPAFDLDFCRKYLGWRSQHEVLARLDDFFAVQNQRQGKGPRPTRRRK